MKKIILAAVALAAFAGTAQAQTLRVGTEGSYAPWNFVNDAGELAGFEIELAQAICEQAALTCEIVQNDWDSIIPNLIAGNYDIIMAGMSITPEREESISFTQDYFPPEPSRYAAAAGENPDFDNLEGKRIGVQVNTIQEIMIQEKFADKNTVVSFATPDQSIADLAAGNIDILLADGNFLNSVVPNSGGTLEFVGPTEYVGGGVGGGMRKEDTALKATIDEALTALKKAGVVDELRIKWFDGVEAAYTE